MHISLSLQGLISMPLKLQHRHLHRIGINGKKMTRCLGSMTGASILATDGSLGSVSDSFFDDLT
jgi:hypothetical protein